MWQPFHLRLLWVLQRKRSSSKDDERQNKVVSKVNTKVPKSANRETPKNIGSAWEEIISTSRTSLKTASPKRKEPKRNPVLILPSVSKRKWRVQGKITKEYGRGDLDQYGWLVSEEEVIDGKETTRIWKGIDKM